MQQKKIFFLLILFMGITACDLKNEGLNLNFDDHPMEVGTFWKYNQQVLVKTYEDENSNTITHVDTFRYDMLIWIDKDTILNDTMNVKAFHTRVDDKTINSIQYKFLDHEGLKTYAFANPGYNLYKKAKEPIPLMDIFSFHPRGIKLNCLQGDIYIEENPPLDIQYPLVQYGTWVYRHPRENYPLQINKKVIGAENLKINGEFYSCFKIRWEYLNDTLFDGIKITDWVGKQGLIKSEIIQERITVTTLEGEPLNGKNIQIFSVLSLDLHGTMEDLNQ